MSIDTIKSLFNEQNKIIENSLVELKLISSVSKAEQQNNIQKINKNYENLRSKLNLISYFNILMVSMIIIYLYQAQRPLKIQTFPNNLDNQTYSNTNNITITLNQIQFQIRKMNNIVQESKSIIQKLPIFLQQLKQLETKEERIEHYYDKKQGYTQQNRKMLDIVKDIIIDKIQLTRQNIKYFKIFKENDQDQQKIIPTNQKFHLVGQEINSMRQHYKKKIEAIQTFEKQFLSGCIREIQFLKQNIQASNITSQQLSNIRQHIDSLSKQIPAVSKQIQVKVNMTKASQDFQYSIFERLEMNYMQLNKRIKQQFDGIQKDCSKEYKIFESIKMEILKTIYRVKKQTLTNIIKKLYNSYIENKKIFQQSLNFYLSDAERYSKIKDFADQIQIQISKKKQELQLTLKKAKSIIIQQIQKSKIETLSFLFKKKIKEIKMIYRASDYDFQTNQFWNRCTNIQNTLIIAKTQYNKIIGGFTPVKWDKQKLNQYSSDPKNQSLIFELTQKHIIPVSYNQWAIYNSPSGSWGPIFGSSDIVIFNKANQSGVNSVSLGGVYKNELYPGRSQQIYTRFCGNPTSNTFKIQQWEVYHLTFL